MQGLRYRDALAHDLEKIVEIYNSTIASRMVTADTEPVTVASRQQWFDAHNTTLRPLWMISDDKDTIVGWVSFQDFYGRPAYSGTAEISIYLDENSRGKGYGKAILAHCLAEAPKYKIKTLLGFIFTHNLPSIRLFQHFGFSEWALLPDIAVLDEQERSLSILGKRLVP